MDKPWYRQLFGRSQKHALDAVQAKANDGDADAQFSVGFAYASSGGEKRDYAQAAEWYLKAADQSHSLAQFNLGVMYAQGQGVHRDEAVAAIWFGKAADQGDAGAQFNLGMNHYRASLGRLPQDSLESRIEAYKWFHLAEAQGYSGSAAACEAVNLHMTREEVADGNHRAASFVVTKRNPQT
jgi:TPR repeat protein